jgi:hypothetical protein
MFFAGRMAANSVMANLYTSHVTRVQAPKLLASAQAKWTERWIVRPRSLRPV